MAEGVSLSSSPPLDQPVSPLISATSVPFKQDTNSSGELSTKNLSDVKGSIQTIFKTNSTLIGAVQVNLYPEKDYQQKDLQGLESLKILDLNISQLGNRIIQLESASSFLGKPSVSFSNSDKRRLLGCLKHVLIAKFTHGRPSLASIEQFFSHMQLKGNFSISICDSKHVFIECNLFEDFVKLWIKHIWVIQGFPARLFKWSEHFHPSKESSITPAWIHLPGLPLYLFKEGALLKIGNAIGRPLLIDSRNLTRKRLGCASLCVEVDVSKPLIDEVWINFSDKTTGEMTDGFWQTVLYDKLPSFCSVCNHLGHTKDFCLRINKMGYELAKEDQKREEPAGVFTDLQQGRPSMQTGNSVVTEVENKGVMYAHGNVPIKTVFNRVRNHLIKADQVEGENCAIMTGLEAQSTDHIVQAAAGILEEQQIEAKFATGDNDGCQENSQEKTEHSRLETNQVIVHKHTPAGNGVYVQSDGVRNSIVESSVVMSGRSTNCDKFQSQIVSAAAGVSVVQGKREGKEGLNHGQVSAADAVSILEPSDVAAKADRVTAVPVKSDAESQDTNATIFELLASAVNAAESHGAAATEKLTGMLDKPVAAGEPASLVPGETAAQEVTAGEMHQQVLHYKEVEENFIQGKKESWADQVEKAEEEGVFLENTLPVVSQEEESEEDDINGTLADLHKQVMGLKSSKKGHLVEEEEKQKYKNQDIRITSQLSPSEVKDCAKKELAKVYSTPTSSLPSLTNLRIPDKDGNAVPIYEILEKSARVSELSKDLLKFRNMNESLKGEHGLDILKTTEYYDRFLTWYTIAILQTLKDHSQTSFNQDSTTDKVTPPDQDVIKKGLALDDQEWTTPTRRGRDRNNKKK